MINIFLFVFFFFTLTVNFSNNLAAQTLSVVPVGQAKIDLTSFSISYDQKSKILSNLEKIIKNDFSFYKKIFSFTTDTENSKLKINLSLIKKTKKSFPLKLLSSKNKIVDAKLEVKVQTIFNNQTETFKLVLLKTRETAHYISFRVFKSVNHFESIFKSKIIFVSNINTKRSLHIKELFMMDFDGYNKKQLTFFKRSVLSPAFSPDNKNVSFSIIEGYGSKKNINLYILNLKNKKLKKISSFKGINSGAVFTKDGKSLVLTLSISGNAEIYKINIKNRKLQRLTKNYAPDVDPSIFENKMTFLSGRPGKPMIYTSTTNGLEKNVKRISYVGRFNATPRFSPSGKEIVFSSWLDDRFDLFRVNSDGTGLVRLTKNIGSNEDPSYSKDGQFIVFSSQKVISRKKAVTNLYIIDREGNMIGQLSHKYGNCQSPRFSN